MLKRQQKKVNYDPDKHIPMLKRHVSPVKFHKPVNGVSPREGKRGIVGFCEEAGLTLPTFYRWIRANPDFAAAYEEVRLHRNRYHPDIAEQLPGLFAEGQSLKEVLVAMNIPERTFNSWLEDYLDLAISYEVGKQISEAWWTRLNRQAAKGELEGSNTAAMIFALKHRFGWRDHAPETPSTANLPTWEIHLDETQPEDGAQDEMVAKEKARRPNAPDKATG